MAVKSVTMECDYCEHQSEDDFRSLEEALEYGWFVLQGPERLLGRQEIVFCSKECLLSEL